MSDTTTPTKQAEPAAPAPAGKPEPNALGSLRREIDKLIDDFGHGFWRSPFRRSYFDLEPLQRDLGWGTAPAVDITEKNGGYQMSVELPGLDEKQVQVRLRNGDLVISGEKSEETEDEDKNYHLHERRFGSFERSFRVPDGVDESKISAEFDKGVLTVTLPTSESAKPAEKSIKIAVK